MESLKAKVAKGDGMEKEAEAEEEEEEEADEEDERLKRGLQALCQPFAREIFELEAGADGRIG